MQAQPIKQGKPVEIKPSTAPLTWPEMPEFNTIGRFFARQEFNHQMEQKMREIEVSCLLVSALDMPNDDQRTMHGSYKSRCRMYRGGSCCL